MKISKSIIYILSILEVIFVVLLVFNFLNTDELLNILPVPKYLSAGFHKVVLWGSIVCPFLIILIEKMRPKEALQVGDEYNDHNKFFLYMGVISFLIAWAFIIFWILNINTSQF